MTYKGSNKTNSAYRIYYERANWTLNVLDDEQEKLSKNKTFSEMRLYGLIDLEGYPIEPDESQLVSVPINMSKEKFNRVLPFFADQLKQFYTYMSRIPLLKSKEVSRWLNNPQVYRSYESPSEKYLNYMIEIVTDFIDNGINTKETRIGRKIPSNNITDLNSFVKYFLTFCKHKYTKQPLTYSGWMLSTNSSILNSGAGVVISDLETSEDLPKWDQVINTPEFECYLGSCKETGLSFNFWNPTFLMADFTSPQSIQYFQDNLVFNLEQVFTTFYNKCYNKDIILLNNILIYIYNKFATNQEYDIKFNQTCIKTTWNFIQRLPTNKQTFDNDLEIYMDLKAIENSVFNERELKDLHKKTKKIHFLFDKPTAMDYINKAYQNVFYNQKYSLTQLYNEVIRKQEKEKQKLGENIYGGTNDKTNDFSSY